MNDNYIHSTKIYKALSDPTRLEVVFTLNTLGELSCQELAKHFSLAQPTLSHHFNKLIDAGIVVLRKEGINHFYRINKSSLREAGINLDLMIGGDSNHGME